MQNHTPALKNLQPATPTVEDMRGTHIQYVHARPYEREKMIETGKVIDLQTHKGLLYLRVKPDNPCRLSKWIPETDFMAYVRGDDGAFLAVAAYAAVMLKDFNGYLIITAGIDPKLQAEFWLWASNERRQKESALMTGNQIETSLARIESANV